MNIKFHQFHFIFISFKNENGYIIDKILGTYSYEFSKKVYGGPKIVSGYALRENDTILSVRNTNSNEPIILDSDDKDQSAYLRFLSKIHPNTEIEIFFSRSINNQTIERNVRMVTENWDAYKQSILITYAWQWPEEKSNYLLKEWENHFFEDYPDFTDKLISNVFKNVLTTDEKLEKEKYRKQNFKYLNINSSFLPFEYKYNDELGCHQIIEVVEQFLFLHNSTQQKYINTEFDINKHSDELELLQSNDQIISLECESPQHKISTLNDKHSTNLHKFLGNIKAQAWIKIEIRRDNKNHFYWIATRHFRDHCYNFGNVFMRWIFGQNWQLKVIQLLKIV